MAASQKHLMEKKVVEHVEDIIYLGVVVSSDGKNTKNIIHKRTRTFGTQKQIMHMVKESGKYTMECGIIYLNSLLRGSILYAVEAMMNVKEEDFRKIEQIEEGQLRLSFATNSSCPIHLMYLESGHMAARFQIKRIMINYFQYILHQNVDSILFKMLMAQIAKPVKGDYC